MYRVVVKTPGKYNNVKLGARYCFTKYSVIDLMTNFMSVECECKVEKFIRLNRDIFCWSDVNIGSKIWNKIYEVLEKLTLEED